MTPREVSRVSRGVTRYHDTSELHFREPAREMLRELPSASHAVVTTLVNTHEAETGEILQAFMGSSESQGLIKF